MTTQDIVEAILSINPNVKPLFKAAHIISEERQYGPKAHSEYPFLKFFFDPKFIVVISKQIHVYIIGDKDKGKKYHVLNIEGYHADHLVITLKELTEIIKTTVSEKLFLPNNFYDRIIYMHNEELFIFNRVNALNCSMFTGKSKWTYGNSASTIYDVDYEATISERNTDARKILDQIYDTIEPGFIKTRKKADDSE